MDTQRFTVPELQGVVGVDNPVDPSPQVRSETLLLRSPALLRKVVDDLELAEDPEFNPLLRPPGFLDQAKDLVRRRVQRRVPAGAASSRGSPYWGITLPEKTVDRPLGPQAVREAGDRSRSSDNLSVFNDGRSLVISVTFTSESPERAAQIVNHLFESYLAEKREVRASRNREGLAALQARLEEARNELVAAETAGAGLPRAARDRRGPGRLGQPAAGRGSRRPRWRARARSGRASAANWERAQTMARRGAIPTDIADVLTSQTVSALREREAEAVRRVTELSSRLGPNHPERRAAESELAAARAEIAGRGAARRRFARRADPIRPRARGRARAPARGDARGQATRLSAVQAELLQLEKDFDTRRALYQNLMQRVEQSASEPRDPQVLGVQIVSFAVPPNEPSAPRPALSGGIGMLLGLCLGGLVDRAPRPAARRLPRPGGAGAGDAPAGAGRRAARPRAGARRPRCSPGSPPSRGGWRRRCCAACAPSSASCRPRRRRGASPSPPSAAGESAATLAAAFARVAAMDGLRVLLIEGDLQRPSLAAALGAPESNGLLAAFSQSAPWSDCGHAATRPRRSTCCWSPSRRPTRASCWKACASSSCWPTPARNTTSSSSTRRR